MCILSEHRVLNSFKEKSKGRASRSRCSGRWFCQTTTSSQVWLGTRTSMSCYCRLETTMGNFSSEMPLTPSAKMPPPSRTNSSYYHQLQAIHSWSWLQDVIFSPNPLRSQLSWLRERMQGCYYRLKANKTLVPFSWEHWFLPIRF